MEGTLELTLSMMELAGKSGDTSATSWQKKMSVCKIRSSVSIISSSRLRRGCLE